MMKILLIKKFKIYKPNKAQNPSAKKKKSSPADFTSKILLQ